MEINPLAVALRFLALAYVLTWIIAAVITAEAMQRPEADWSIFQEIALTYTFLPLIILGVITMVLGVGAGLAASGLWIFTGKVEWPFKKQKGEEN